ncbi:unnamed protein product [Nyctereutes procyonoides]|uniref:(raccoon dog) hypothetical protein n=1 Tax=Nyctereutes procyonoides TaxID=34880 RepID=A0A811Y9Y8_NYCPR|nr:unnamed protein product [Nyctereutes procyonoides]
MITSGGSWGVGKMGEGASGMAVSDGVIKVFNDMKVPKSSTPEEVKECKKAVLFCLSEDKKNIILEEGKEILVGDVGQTVDNPYATFVKMLPDKDCRYALEEGKEILVGDVGQTVDNPYATFQEGGPGVYILAPESVPLKSKMIYASSKDHELQANCYKEVKDHCTLAEKLGGSGVISWRASPPAPCLEHLAAPDLPMGVASCPLPARPEGLGDPSRGRAIPSPQLPNSSLTPWTFLLSLSLTVLAFPNRF